jgi:hypothetical protein
MGWCLVKHRDNFTFEFYLLLEVIMDSYITTPTCRVLLEKLTVTQLVKKFPTFIKPESSLPCSQQPATGPYPKSDESNPHLPTIFPYVPF